MTSRTSPPSMKKRDLGSSSQKKSKYLAKIRRINQNIAVLTKAEAESPRALAVG